MKPPINGVRPVKEVRRGDIIVVEIPADRFICVAEAINWPDDFAGCGEYHTWPKGTAWAIEMNVIGGPFVEKGYTYWKQGTDGGLLTNLSRLPYGCEIYDRKSHEVFGMSYQVTDNETGRAVKMKFGNGRTEFTVGYEKAGSEDIYGDHHIDWVTFGLEYALA